MIASDHLESLGPRADPLIGATLAGRYRVLRRLGRGGMGSVYEAEHTMIGRRVAVKLLHTRLSMDEVAVRRFMNEARAAAMIRHPNILECTDMGQTEDGSPFVVLELLEGQDLAHLLAEVRVLPTGRAVRIALRVASALSAAHAQGVVHRDIKPENIFLVADEGVRVLDFGVSKFTRLDTAEPGTATGTVLGTPVYMAPEQIRDSSRVEPQADVYALGVLLYECLSGDVPFSAPSLIDLFVKIATVEATPLADLRPDLPRELCDAVMRAMDKSLEARFPSMDDFAAAIAPFEDDDREPPAEVVAQAAARADTYESRVPSTPREVPSAGPRGDDSVIGGHRAEAMPATVEHPPDPRLARPPEAKPSSLRGVTGLVVAATLIGVPIGWVLLRGAEPSTEPPREAVPVAAIADAPSTDPDEPSSEPAPALTYAELVRAPGTHQGETLSARGLIAGPAEDEGAWVAFVAADGCGGAAACALGLVDLPVEVEAGQAVSFTGTIDGELVYRNAAGDRPEVSRVRVASVDVLAELETPDVDREHLPSRPLAAAPPPARPPTPRRGTAPTAARPASEPAPRTQRPRIGPQVSDDEL